MRQVLLYFLVLNTHECSPYTVEENRKNLPKSCLYRCSGNGCAGEYPSHVKRSRWTMYMLISQDALLRSKFCSTQSARVHTLLWIFNFPRPIWQWFPIFSSVFSEVLIILNVFENQRGLNRGPLRFIMSLIRSIIRVFPPPFVSLCRLQLSDNHNPPPVTKAAPKMTNLFPRKNFVIPHVLGRHWSILLFASGRAWPFITSFIFFSRGLCGRSVETGIGTGKK